MTPPTTRPRPGWAEPIPALSLAGNRAEVSATATAVQGAEGDDRRWLLHAETFGPQGGRRGRVELILDAATREALLAQLLAGPGTGPLDPADAAAKDLASFRQLATELDDLTEQMDADAPDVPDAVHDRRDEIDRELAALALALLGGAR